MKKLLLKELKLTASPLSYFFIAFSFMALIPQYPILVGAFFVCFGIFRTFLSAREARDTVYTAMLPVKKSDVVKARFAFIVFIQLTAFALMAVLTALRMAFLNDALPYTQNVLMNANLAYLGWVLAVYAIFNLAFVCGFYKTAYKMTLPFVLFCVTAFIVIALAEALHHFPGMESLNSTVYAPAQLIVFALGAAVYLVLTLVSERLCEKRFEKVDL